jgi:hypothetical protein
VAASGLSVAQASASNSDACVGTVVVVDQRALDGRYAAGPITHMDTANSPAPLVDQSLQVVQTPMSLWRSGGSKQAASFRPECDNWRVARFSRWPMKAKRDQ